MTKLELPCQLTINILRTGTRVTAYSYPSLFIIMQGGQTYFIFEGEGGGGLHFDKKYRFLRQLSLASRLNTNRKTYPNYTAKNEQLLAKLIKTGSIQGILDTYTHIHIYTCASHIDNERIK